jgi:hypothetical protein
MKFERTYKLLVQGATGEFHTITYPMTTRFFVQNQTTSVFGSASIQVYNLAKETRADLYQDIYKFWQYRQIILSAGYVGDGNAQAVIFQGGVYQCFSYREGPDWVTEIQAIDGGFAVENSLVSVTLANNYTFKSVARHLCEAMSPTVQVGILGDIDDPVVENKRRGIVMCGNPWDFLVRMTTARDLSTFIYQEKAYVLSQQEYIEDKGALAEISTDTGMIGSPRMQDAQVTVKMIFEPRLQPQRVIKMRTDERGMSGPYLVKRVMHRGTISGSVCESLTTDALLFKPAENVEVVSVQ